MLEPLCNQTVNLKTDAKTIYYSKLKFKYNPSYIFRVQKRLKYLRIFKQQPQISSNQYILPKVSK